MHQVILALIILQFQMSHLQELSSLESISIAPHSHYVVTTHEFWPISNTSQSDLDHSETWAKSSICGQQPQSPVVKVESLSGSQIVGIVPCTCSRYMTGFASDCPWVLHSCPQHHWIKPEQQHFKQGHLRPSGSFCNQSSHWRVPFHH